MHNVAKYKDHILIREYLLPAEKEWNRSQNDCDDCGAIKNNINI